MKNIARGIVWLVSRAFQTIIVGIVAVSIIAVPFAIADYTATQGSGITMASIVISAKHYFANVLCDPTIGETQCQTVNSNNSALIDANTSSQIHSDLTASIPAGSNPIGSIVGSPNITAYDCSGTISSGGTAQNAFGAISTLHGFTIKNIDSSAGSGELLWFSFTTTAAANSTQSYELLPPSGTTQDGGSYTTPLGFGFNGNLSVIAATSTHKYSCTYW